MNNKENLFYITIIALMSKNRLDYTDFAEGRYDGLIELIKLFGWLEEYKRLEFDFIFLANAFWTEHYDLKEEYNKCCSYEIKNVYDLLDCLMDLKFFNLWGWVYSKVNNESADITKYMRGIE